MLSIWLAVATSLWLEPALPGFDCYVLPPCELLIKGELTILVLPCEA